MIIINGSARFESEHRAAALRIGIEHSARSRAEPGCLAHNCLIDAEDPSRIVFVEMWEDMAAVHRHFAVPASGQFVEEFTAIALCQPEIRIFESRPVQSPAL